VGVDSGESATITEDMFDRCDEKCHASDLAVDGRNLIELLLPFKPSCSPRPRKSVSATYSNTTLTRHNTRRIGGIYIIVADCRLTTGESTEWQCRIGGRRIDC
jgi:hypothetical protein